MINEKTDAELCKNIQSETDVNESLQELSNRHSGIYYHIVNRYLPKDSEDYVFGIDKDFVSGSKDLIIYNAAIKYDEDKQTKFSTFLGNQARYFCLRSKKDAKPVQLLSDAKRDLWEELDVDTQDSIDEQLVKYVLDLVKEHPDKRAWQIFKMRYVESDGSSLTTWREISQKIKDSKGRRHISGQACIDIHNKVIKEIRKKLEKNS